MPNFKDIFLEALTYDQERIVDRWDWGDTSFSDHAFGGKTKQIDIPLEHPDVEPHPEIKDHLEKHGYKVHDYRKGLASDKYGRQVSIGKVLRKTKAGDDLTHQFVTDPRREAMKNSEHLRVFITRAPYDVAGMSTNRGWSSCMNLEDKDTGNKLGAYAQRHLPHDLKHGTHVAYLSHMDDEDLENPVARIALKPFVSEGGHKIIRPENVSYGHGGDAFSHTVRKWAEENFPLKDGVYRKNSGTYNDDRIGITFKPEHVDDMINDRDDDVVIAALKHPFIENHHLEKVMQGRAFNSTHNIYNNGVRSTVLSHPKLDRKHITSTIENSDNMYDGNSILANPNTRPEDIDRIIEMGKTSWFRRAIISRAFRQKHVDSIVYNDNHREFANQIATVHPKYLTKEHINHLLDEDMQGHHNNVSNLPNLNADHIHKILDYHVRTGGVNYHQYREFYGLMRGNFDGSKKLTPEHFDKYLQFSSGRDLPLHHPAVEERHLDKLLESPDYAVRERAIAHPKATEKHWEAGLEDSHDRNVATAISKHKNLSADRLSEILGKTNSNFVASAAMDHPNFNSGHIDQIMNKDFDYGLDTDKLFANPHITRDHVANAIRNNKYNMIPAALKHPLSDRSDVDHIFNTVTGTKMRDTTRALINHPHITGEDLHNLAIDNHSSYMDDQSSMIARHEKVLPKTINHMLDKGFTSYDLQTLMQTVKHMAPETIHHALDKNITRINDYMPYRRDLQPEHISRLITLHHERYQTHALSMLAQHTNADSKNLHHLIDTGNSLVVHRVLEHPNASQEHFDHIKEKMGNNWVQRNMVAEVAEKRGFK